MKMEERLIESRSARLAVAAVGCAFALAFGLASPSTARADTVTGVVTLSGTVVSVGNSVYASVDFGTEFTSIDMICFQFTFQDDLLDFGDELSITPLNLLPSMDGGGFLNVSGPPQSGRTICDPNAPGYGPLDSVYLDGAENQIELAMRSGSVRIASLAITVYGSPGASLPAPSAPDLTAQTDTGI